MTSHTKMLIFGGLTGGRHASVTVPQPYQTGIDWLHCCVCWGKSAHVGHILALDNAEGQNLYFRLLQHGPVWSEREGGGTYCPLQSLPHSFEEQPSFITNRHTKRWAPRQYRTDPFMRTSAQHFSNHCALSTATSPFQIPAHE